MPANRNRPPSPPAQVPPLLRPLLLNHRRAPAAQSARPVHYNLPVCFGFGFVFAF